MKSKHKLFCFFIFNLFLLFTLVSFSQSNAGDINFDDFNETNYFKPNIKFASLITIKDKDTVGNTEVFFDKNGKIVKYIDITNSVEYIYFDHSLYSVKPYKSNNKNTCTSIFKKINDSTLIAEVKLMDTCIYEVYYLFKNNNLIRKEIKGKTYRPSSSYLYSYDSLNRLVSMKFYDKKGDFSYVCFTQNYLDTLSYFLTQYNSSEEVEAYYLKKYDVKRKVIETSESTDDSTEIVKNVYSYDNDKLVKVSSFIIKNKKTKKFFYTIINYNENGEAVSEVEYSPKDKLYKKTFLKYEYYKN